MLEEKFQYQNAALFAIFTMVYNFIEKCDCPGITPTSAGAQNLDDSITATKTMLQIYLTNALQLEDA
jgi:hypothetical protein